MCARVCGFFGGGEITMLRSVTSSKEKPPRTFALLIEGEPLEMGLTDPG